MTRTLKKLRFDEFDRIGNVVLADQTPVDQRKNGATMEVRWTPPAAEDDDVEDLWNNVPV